MSSVPAECATDYVVDFTEADGNDPGLFGGKGAGLARLVGLGLPVPPGFIVSCRAGREYLEHQLVPDRAVSEIHAYLRALEKRIGRGLGDARTPLLVSVRSGAPVSMPGMMDTVLNVGLNPVTVAALAQETNDPAFAWSCYERFVESFARVVRGVPPADVEDALLDAEVHGKSGEERSRAVVEVVQRLIDPPLPDDATQQVLETIEAVFRSWMSPRAERYRKFRDIDPGMGTAAVVQTMVFGNRGLTSGSGVAFTRDPSTGEPGAFGDFLFDCQGEDVVDGSHDPLPLDTLATRLPECFARLEAALRIIERHTRDLCEVEFTVDNGELWILQTRVGQRSGRAAVRVAVDLVTEGVLDSVEAARRVTPAQIEAAAAPTFARPPRTDEIIARGAAGSPGAAVGRVVFDVDQAVKLVDGANGHRASRDTVPAEPSTDTMVPSTTSTSPWARHVTLSRKDCPSGRLGFGPQTGCESRHPPARFDFRASATEVVQVPSTSRQIALNDIYKCDSATAIDYYRYLTNGRCTTVIRPLTLRRHHGATRVTLGSRGG